MNVLAIIWTAALVLAGGALLWMSGLIVLRLVHERRTADRLVARRAVDKALVALLLGRCDVETELGPYRTRARLMAEALLEILAIVRGHDREIVLSAYQSLGVDAAMRARLTRGSQAGRLACIEALANFPDPATERALRSLMARAAPHLRLAALRSLAAGGVPVTVDDLLRDLAAGALPVSGLLGEFLRSLVAADPAAAVAALQDDRATATVRVLLLDSLGAAGDYGALPCLIDQAGTGSADVRAAAVKALGRLKHPGARTALAQALSDPDAQVRASAAVAVGDAGLDALAGALADRLGDEVWRVRTQAASALRRLGASGARELQQALLSPVETVHRTASLALAEQGAVR